MATKVRSSFYQYFYILFLSLFATSSNAFEIEIVPAIISSSKCDVEIHIISSTKSTDGIYLPKFNWRFPALTFLVDTRGRFYPNYYYLKDGLNLNVPYSRSSVFLTTPFHIMGGGFNFRSGSAYQILGGETYYFVSVIRRPFNEPGVIFSKIGRIYVNKEKNIETLDTIEKTALPSLVMQTLKNEIFKTLLEQGFSREISSSF